MQFHRHRFFFKATSVCTPRARPRQQLLVCSRGHCSSVDGLRATRHVQQNADEPALQQMSPQCWRLCLSVCLPGVVLSQWTKKKKLLTFIPSLVATDFQPREQQHQMLPQRGLASHVIHDSPPPPRKSRSNLWLVRGGRKVACASSAANSERLGSTWKRPT
jgi:hypothetical protein